MMKEPDHQLLVIALGFAFMAGCLVGMGLGAASVIGAIIMIPAYGFIRLATGMRL